MPTPDRRRFLALSTATGASALVLGGTAAHALDDLTASLLGGRPAGPGHLAEPALPVPPLPDPLQEGRATAPPAGTRIPYARGPVDARAAARGIPAEAPFTFKTSGYRCARSVRDVLRPWRDRDAPRVDTAPHDIHGVRMFELDGRLYDHPVGQIQFGLQNITSYRRTGDLFYLNRARAQAKRLIDRRIEARGAWWFPYPFDWAHAVHTGLAYRAPWYSGMAQGEALSLFAQLIELPAVDATERARYRAAADGAFASLLKAGPRKPWVTARDGAGYLWIHEYPMDPPGTSDYTYNGYMFAALGLWDYVQLTGNALAERLFDGALTALDVYFAAMRNKGWLSDYCLTHQIPTASYHPVHINLLRQLHWLSGSVRLAHLSDVLMDDHPHPKLGAGGGTISLAAGRYTLYRFSASGAVTASRAVTFSRDTAATASHRTRIKGGGVHYLISSGAYQGWYVPEFYPRVYLRGEWFRSVYAPRRTATFPAQVSVECHKVAADGTITGIRTVSFPHDSAAPFDRRSIVNGRPMVRITAGPLTGFWAPSSHVRSDGR
ncbi:D-glucuronyl C5-epimerase family protein [Streptomyces sp. NPDC057638]|uniref:D-glucuronyl C5-epimerase family protein n=1 Tax=Streptomyces sp. NPDC057638 TaxID=3346190 RepID=UPI0036CEA563